MSMFHLSPSRVNFRGVDVSLSLAQRGSLLQRVVESQKGREAKTYKIDMGIQGRTLLPIPLRFKGLF
jgi:hypothetical protein